LFSDVEKKIEVEKVSQHELNIKEEYKDALSCIGFEKDEWHKYYTTVNIVMIALLIFTFLLIAGMALFVARTLYLILQKQIIYISKNLNKEL